MYILHTDHESVLTYADGDDIPSVFGFKTEGSGHSIHIHL